MGIRDIFGAMARRWYVVLIGIVLTVGAGWQIYQANPPEYTARGLVLFLPPVGDPTLEETAGANPFLQLAGLDLTARVVVATYSSTAFAEELEEISPYAEVEVNIDDSTRGGIVAVNVKDRGEKRALRTLDYVTGSVSERLTSLQQEVGVAEKDAVRSMLLAKDTEAKPDFQSLIRVLVIVIGGGLGATLATALVLDVILVRRQRRRGVFEVSSHIRRSKRAAASGRNRADGATSTHTTTTSSESVPLPVLDDELTTVDPSRKTAKERTSAPSSPRAATHHDTRP